MHLQHSVPKLLQCAKALVEWHIVTYMLQAMWHVLTNVARQTTRDMFSMWSDPSLHATVEGTVVLFMVCSRGNNGLMRSLIQFNQEFTALCIVLGCSCI
jgi:hypothetical protein